MYGPRTALLFLKGVALNKLICGLAIAVLPWSAWAGGNFTSQRFPVGTTLTPTNSISVTNRIGITGYTKSLTIALAGGSATVRVTTVAGIGSTLGTAKTVWGPGVVTVAGLTTNLEASGTFLADDELVARYDNAAITSSVTSIKTILIYEQ